MEDGNAIRIDAVRTRRDLRRFIDLPYRLYRGSPCWVPPLRLEQRMTLSRKSNPFWGHAERELFLAFDRGGQPIGRIAAIVNRAHLERYDDGNGFFGFFECEDRGAAAALLEHAAGWLKSRGLTGMRGPCNPSMNDVSGLLVKGFDRAPSFYMPYNPPSYEEYFEQCGLQRVMTTYAYYLHKRYCDFEQIRPWLDELRAHYPGLRIVNGDRKRFAAQAELVLEIYNDGWSANWGHVPMTRGEFRRLARDFKHLLDPDLAFFLELDGRTIGFVLALPDLNEALRRVHGGRLLPFGWLKLLVLWKWGGIRTARAALAGVRAEHRGQGLAALMGLLAVQHNWLGCYEAVELSWVLQSNKLLVDALERIGAVRDKEYAIFERAL